MNTVAKIVFWSVLSAATALVFLFRGLWGCSIAIAAIAVIEFLLRDNSDEFFQENSVNLKKIPKLILERNYEFFPEEEKINWVHDDELGWRLKPNTELGINISIPGLGLNHKFTYRTDENGTRRTSNDLLSSRKQRPVIAILGCSFTYGHSLDDQDTYAWLLQERFSDKRVINYAVAGYSLYQCLLTLEKNIKKDNPGVVVVGFHPDLGWRNTNSFEWVRLIRHTWRIPSCVSKGGRLHRHSPEGYVSLPFSKLRVVKMLELNLNRLIYRGRGKKIVIRNTMEHLLLQIRALCEQHGAKLIVACIDDSSDYYDFLIKNGFCWCVTGVDTKELAEDRKFRWILYPFDNHPNQEANQKYAEAIGNSIEDLLVGRYSAPEALQRNFKTEERGAYIYPHF